MHLQLYYLYTFIILLVTTLLCMAVWYYRKVIVPYKEFPTVSIVAFIKQLLFKPIPKDITPISFHVQALIELCKPFQSEGLCFGWLFYPYLAIFSEETVKLFTNEEAALNKPHDYEVLQGVFGKGLITSNGDMWKKQRKTLNPLFNATALKAKLPIFNKHADILVKQLLEVPHDSVDIHKYLKLCTFSNICETIIGLDVKERKTDAEQITKLFTEISDKIIDIILQRLVPKFTLKLFPSGRKYFRQIQQLRELMTKILLEMKEDTLSREKTQRLDDSEDPCSVPRKSFAQRLVQLHLEDPSSFTLEYMLDELTTVVFAGYDTTSYALTWCLFLLGHHQDVQDQVYNELESVTAGDLSFHDLSNLTYMDCVIKESLRIYPTVPAHGRRLEKSVQLEKYNIPKGTIIGFFTYLYHRNPKMYPDPEKFDPGRFSGDSEQGGWTHVQAFSEGLRSCIGKKFALMEIKIVLAHILRNFKVTSLERREDVNLSWNIVLIPDKPIHVRLTPRREFIQIK